MTFFAMKLRHVTGGARGNGWGVIAVGHGLSFSIKTSKNRVLCAPGVGHEGGGGGLGLWTQVLQPGGDEVEDCLHYLLEVGCEVVAG